MDATNVADYTAKLLAAAEFVRQRLGEAEIAVVLGTGLGDFAEEIEDQKFLPYEKIPSMPQPTVSGHSGRLIHGRVGDKKLLCLAGRSHVYEGLHMYQLTFATRLLALLGCRLYIATNAAGGALDGMPPGSIMMLEDHMNMMKRNPSCDTFTNPLLGRRGLDCSSIYSKRLISLANKVAADQELNLFKGVYSAWPGPTYETPTEVAGGKKLGAGSFGMSTVPGATVAASMGMEVFAMSLCTNLAAGISTEELNHAEVKEVALEVAPKFRKFVKQMIISMEVPEESHIIKEIKENINKGDSVSAGADSPLPPSIAPSCPTSAIFNAAEAVRGILYQGSRNAEAEALSPTRIAENSSVALKDIPSFPAVSPSGRDGILVSVSSSSGVRVLVVKDTHEEGFSCEEGIFLARLFCALDITLLYHTVSGALTEQKSDGDDIDVFVFDDIFDWSTIGAIAPESRAINSGYLSNSDENSSKSTVCSTQFGRVGDTKEPFVKHGAFASFLGPSYPTPADTALSRAAGALVTGISSVTLPLCAVSLQMNTVLMGVADRVSPSFKAAANASEQIAKFSKYLWNCIAAARPSPPLQDARNLQQPLKTNGLDSTSTPLTHLLSPPITQGNYDKAAAMAQSVKECVKNESFSVIVVEESLQCALEGWETLQVEGWTSEKQTLKLRSDGRVVGVVQHTFQYRGSPLCDVTLFLRVLRMSGAVRVVLIGNVFGAAEDVTAGDIVLFNDHVNMSGRSPLFGVNEDRWGTRFPDNSTQYDKEMRRAIQEKAERDSVVLKGVIATGVAGAVHPSAAAVSLCNYVGGKVMAVSLYPEAITCRHLGLPVVTLSLVRSDLRDGKEFGTQAEKVKEKARMLMELAEAVM